MDNEQILGLVNAGKLDEASQAIRDRLAATGARPAVVSAAMYYCYERGHSAGQDEVLRLAFNLLTEVFEAK